MPDGRRVALVTGAGGPVGAAIRRRLAAEGFTMVAMDEDPQAGGDVVAVRLSDRAEVKAAVDRVTRELGEISVLVTAPWHHDAAAFGQMNQERWQRLLMAHLASTVNACAAVGPGMARSGRGTIVTISSWLALAGVAGESYAAAATGSILAFTKSFAIEVARQGLRVNCVAVGPRDLVQPSEIADTVAFLVNDGDFFVGEVFNAAAGSIV
jgi:2-hydroxycyclohexanecarboxyl-CoA dehydrogenase